MITGIVRASYAHLLQAVAMNDGQGEPKFSVSLIIPKGDTDTLNKIKAAIEAAIALGIETKWGGKKPANLKLPLRDGDTEREENEEYRGAHFVTASSKTKPGIVDRANQPILDESEIYSGMYVRASINFYPFNSNGSKGVACGLNHVQKVRDGEPLGGRGRAEDDFEPLSDEDLLG